MTRLSGSTGAGVGRLTQQVGDGELLPRLQQSIQRLGWADLVGADAETGRQGSEGIPRLRPIGKRWQGFSGLRGEPCSRDTCAREWQSAIPGRGKENLTWLRALRWEWQVPRSLQERA